MEKLNLDAYGVVEMAAVEMETVEGGNPIRAVWNALCSAWEWLVECCLNSGIDSQWQEY